MAKPPAHGPEVELDVLSLSLSRNDDDELPMLGLGGGAPDDGGPRARQGDLQELSLRPARGKGSRRSKAGIQAEDDGSADDGPDDDDDESEDVDDEDESDESDDDDEEEELPYLENAPLIERGRGVAACTPAPEQVGCGGWNASPHSAFCTSVWPD